MATVKAAGFNLNWLFQASKIEVYANLPKVAEVWLFAMLDYGLRNTYQYDIWEEEDLLSTQIYTRAGVYHPEKKSVLSYLIWYHQQFPDIQLIVRNAQINYDTVEIGLWGNPNAPK